MSIWTIALASFFVVALVGLAFRGQKSRFKKAVQSAIQELQERQVAIPAEMKEAGAVKDLELQWNDHFHMRDQSWRTLSNSALFFIGIVGLEIYQGTPRIIMIAGYAALILLSVLGLIVALHHRYIQQRIKFPIILRYEIVLGLTPVFEDILDRHSNKGFSTSTFIVFAHAALCVIATLLLSIKVYEVQIACDAINLPCLLKRGSQTVIFAPPSPQ